MKTLLHYPHLYKIPTFPKNYRAGLVVMSGVGTAGWPIGGSNSGEDAPANRPVVHASIAVSNSTNTTAPAIQLHATALVLGIFRSGETLRIFRMLPKIAEMVRELDPALR